MSAVYPRVQELYNTTWSGQPARKKEKSELERKKGLEKQRREEIIKSAFEHFKSDKKLTRSGIGRAIGNKLNAFNSLFAMWKEGKDGNVDGLTDLDFIGVEDFDKYKQNPDLFDKLDRNMYEENSDTD